MHLIILLATSNFFLLANTAFGPPVEGCKENFFFFKAFFKTEANIY